MLVKRCSKKIIYSANYKYPRNDIPKAGPVGGPCLSKDSYILKQSFNDIKTNLIVQGRKTNEEIIKTASNKIIEYLLHSKKEALKISIIGITYKGNPDTNDIRNSTALDVIESLKKAKTTKKSS